MKGKTTTDDDFKASKIQFNIKKKIMELRE